MSRSNNLDLLSHWLYDQYIDLMSMKQKKLNMNVGKNNLKNTSTVRNYFRLYKYEILSKH